MYTRNSKKRIFAGFLIACMSSLNNILNRFNDPEKMEENLKDEFEERFNSIHKEILSPDFKDY